MNLTMSKYNKPTVKPKRPFYSSGPCVRYPKWDTSFLENALLGRSHRSDEAIAQIQHITSLMRETLEIPDNYQICFISGSASAAVEAALWNLIGPNGVDVFHWDVFGKLWAMDIKEQLKVNDIKLYSADFGKLPDFKEHIASRDVVFTWTGTTSGVAIENTNWIGDNHPGLVICDTTSAAFTEILPWHRLDVNCFSLQKGLGSEAGLGVCVLSPKAIERLNSYDPPWPMPRMFRLKSPHLFDGYLINTPSMLSLADFLDALKWAKSIGGVKSLAIRTSKNRECIDSWLAKQDQYRHTVTNPASRARSVRCIQSNNNNEHQIAKILREEQVAYDIKGYTSNPGYLRIWLGPTVETEDIETLLPWLEWAANL
jgi:phosphoserine aminotransferase